MTQTSPEQRHERMADHIEDTYESLFDPLATMDSIKWQTTLERTHEGWLESDRRCVADILEGRHFKGFV
jgi:hypothetical protein